MKKRFERKKIKLSEIKTDPSNPNVMSDKKQEALSKSMERFGYVQDIVVDKSTMLIADGHHRLKELLERGIKTEEVLLYDFKDDNERRLFRQLANKIKGDHDPEKDALEFQALMEEYPMEDLAAYIGDSEQELIKTISLLNKEEQAPKIEGVENVYKHHVTCPKCGHQFQKSES